jgi:aminoglycoside phosphotransferase (APT) family kinase protein
MGYEHLAPLEGVRRFLDERFGSSADEVTLERLGEGHSNITFTVTRGSEAWVLRRPPRGDIQPGTHEMHREFGVMKALHDARSVVPVPEPIALCDDQSYIGAPFYVMSYVDGIVVRGALPPHLDPPAERRRIGEELVDRLADIHDVDWQAIGLQSMARKPEAFLERNLGRMQQLYDAVSHREVPEIDEVGEWLRANTPPQREVTLTHGDYKLDNVMLSSQAPARIVAVVDWEISTIGDPLVDLGWLLYFAPSSGGVPGMESAGAAGYPSLQEMAERYAQRRDVSLDDIRFYAAMAGWKIAIIMEGSNLRFKQGNADDSMFAALDAGVPALADRSRKIISGELPV